MGRRRKRGGGQGEWRPIFRVITGGFLLESGSIARIERFRDCNKGSRGRRRRGGFQVCRRLAKDRGTERPGTTLFCNRKGVDIGWRMMT